MDSLSNLQGRAQSWMGNLTMPRVLSSGGRVWQVRQVAMWRSPPQLDRLDWSDILPGMLCQMASQPTIKAELRLNVLSNLSNVNIMSCKTQKLFNKSTCLTYLQMNSSSFFPYGQMDQMEGWPI